MTTLLAAYLTFMALLILLIFSLFIRINKVSDWRRETLDKVSAAAVGDIRAGREFGWRFRTLDSVSFERQVFMLWKPLDSFYDSLDFTKES